MTRRGCGRCFTTSASVRRRSTRRSRARRTRSRSSMPAPVPSRRSTPRPGTRATRSCTRARRTRRTPPRTWRRSWRCYVLLGFSVIVSLFGMVNTLVLSVFERTRELGMLRAIGMTRRQARRMIRHESVITALIGAALGLGLGIVLAALATQALSQYGVALALPVPTLSAFALVAVLAGIGAAIMP